MSTCSYIKELTAEIGRVAGVGRERTVWFVAINGRRCALGYDYGLIVVRAGDEENGKGRYWEKRKAETFYCMYGHRLLSNVDSTMVCTLCI